ncbi:MAG: hypothetical protein C7B44_05330 [Sulfobacillus thermosulfidooxidans]|nr:MAG: hypothetical protein C7B44_05330 [Sulfobacillus thermosulfidooxidans]
MVMKYMAFVLGILGGVTGILAGLFEHIPGVYTALFHNYSRYGVSASHLTVAVGVLCLISGVLFLVKPLAASWIGLVATVLGALGSLTLWLIPGSFIFMATVIGFFDVAPKRAHQEAH